MQLRTLSIIVLGILTAGAGFRSAESDASPPSVIEVVNDAGKSFTFTAADLAKLSQKDVTAKDHKGEQAKYSGVFVADVLKLADVALGERLRGRVLTNYLLVEAVDDYRVVFSLPEVDPESTDNVVLLANSRNGAALDAAHGPLQIIIPAEKRHARWVKKVVRMTVRADAR